MNTTITLALFWILLAAICLPICIKGLNNPHTSNRWAWTGIVLNAASLAINLSILAAAL